LRSLTDVAAPTEATSAAQPGVVAPAGHPMTSTGISNEKLAMWVFLGSECLLFGGLISTYLLYKTRTAGQLSPHERYDIPFTSISSFVLLMSSLTMVLAVAAITRGDH
jgi:cytochrome c oxidase subunit 3/cytochrome o ubiquinol oxidase subunit 3